MAVIWYDDEFLEGMICINSSYEVVFIPYDGDVDSFEPITFGEMVLGYRILQTRGCLPGDYRNSLPDDYQSMEYIAVLFVCQKYILLLIFLYIIGKVAIFSG